METKDREYSEEEVSKHNTKSSVWIIISENVLDVTKFLDKHPGGADRIMEFAGRDATQAFMEIHSDKAIKMTKGFKIGFIKKND